MSHLPANALLAAVLDALRAMPGGAAIDELSHQFSQRVTRRTLQRRLAEWAASGAIRAQGAGKARRYFAADVPGSAIALPRASLAIAEAAPAPEYVPLSDEGHAIRELVRQPVVRRSPVGYRREFLDRYEPNVTSYIPERVALHLLEIGRTPNGTRPAGTYARDILGRLLIDLSWASSRLEGNTYSLLDTEQLIRDGRVPSGKDIKETQMILNHKSAIELLVDSAAETAVDRFTLLNLHALLSDNLLEDPLQAGRLRTVPVGIGGSVYLPTAIPQLIEEQFAQLIDKAAAIRDPFEQGFFLMVHIPYLQPFVDVNKRTSRLAANIPLIRGNLVPMSFIDVPEQAYVDGLVGVYEQNRVELLRDVFVWAYERSSRRYKTVRDSLPEPDPFRLAHRLAFIEVIGKMVRECLPATAGQVAELASPLVKAEEIEQFTRIVMQELGGLHEGNIARFRLRPSQFRSWQAAGSARNPVRH
jgi:fido (protein-threonine AMPylation protein)